MGKMFRLRWLIPFCALIVLLGGCTVGKEQTSKEKETEQPSTSGDLETLDEKVTVVIAEDGAALGACFYIATEKGYFDEYNIEVEFAQLNYCDGMLPALAAGEVDIA